MPGSIIATYFQLKGIAFALVAMGVNLVASAIVSKSLGPRGPLTTDQTGNPGNRIQLPPATDNKLPVIYGQSYVGGTITDLTITSDNQTLYYVLSLCEVTNTETGGTPDTITFGDVYYGGKKCIFDGTDLTKVVALLDTSTGIQEDNVNGYINIYFYNNGSNTPVNSAVSAINVLSDPNLIYQWNITKLMSNTAFAIVKLKYNSDAGVTGLQQTKFTLTNSRFAPGDCFLDYMTSTRYGAALDVAQIDTASLTALNTYSASSFTYVPYGGGTSTQTRFRFDGLIDTNNSVMEVLQQMSTSCDCLIKYNEIEAQWGVIVQSPTYSVAMAINDSNMVSALQITPTDLASSPNIVEVKFPNGAEQDSFATSTYSLQEIAPGLLYPNEPTNKQTLNLPLVNNDIRAQYITVRLLKANREDLAVQVVINYTGIQLEAGDIVSLTSVNYGWAAKLFRVNQVTEQFGEDGQVTAKLQLMEYNPTVFDDVSLTQFTPAPNTGISDPLTFGTIPAPVVAAQYPNAAVPVFDVAVTASSSGIIQYGEIWYSAFASPTAAQRFFGGTTIINSAGNPYVPGSSMGNVQIANLPQGDWYFFSRMVNSLGASIYSAASSLFQWRPTTFQYSNRYLVVAYADSITGTGISTSPVGKSYYGLYSVDTGPAYSSNPALYTWFLAQPTFGTNVFLIYANRQNRKFSFDSDFASQAAGTGAWVPTTTAQFDPSLWSALPVGTNVIDLDVRTGQLITTGTTNIGSGEIAVTNNQDGRVVAQLATLLNFGDGIDTKTGIPATLTIDKYGRVLGFASPDEFGYTLSEFVATASQTVFTPTARSADYFAGQSLIFRNGCLLDTTEYTDTTTTVTLTNACAVGDIVAIISYSAKALSATYVDTLLTVQTVATTVVTYNAATKPNQLFYAGDIVTFLNTGTPTQYTIASVNYATRQITFTATVTGVVAGAVIYVYRPINTAYRPISRWTTTLTNVSVYTPTEFNFRSAYEKLFLNGTCVNDLDYDLTATLSFIQNVTGLLTVVQFAENLLTTPAGGSSSVAINTVVGQSTYTYSYNTLAFELYGNGALQEQGSDYTTGTGSYTLSVAPTTNLTILQQTAYQRTDAA